MSAGQHGASGWMERVWTGCIVEVLSLEELVDVPLLQAESCH